MVKVQKHLRISMGTYRGKTPDTEAHLSREFPKLSQQLLRFIVQTVGKL